MRFVAAVLVAVCLAPRVHAQSPAPAPAEVQGTVTDWKDSPVANATLSLVAGETTYQTHTDADGRYRFASIAPGRYLLSVGAEGFPPVMREVDLRRSPRGPFDIKLQVLVAETIEVKPSTDQAAGNFASLTLSRQDLEGVPAGLLFQRLRELAGATGRPETIPIYVDGFRAGLRLPPKEAIEMVRVSNSFAAEFPEIGYGRIEITTKPGVDGYHGQFQLDMNDDVLNARDAFAPRRGASQSRNYSGYFGGPIVPSRWDFLAYSGRWEQDLIQVVNATVVDPGSFVVQPLNVNFPTPTRSTNVFVQTGYLVSPAHSVSGSFSRTIERARSQGLDSGRELPEYGFHRSAFENTTRAALISSLGANTLNELRLEWSRRGRDVEAATARPAVVVFDAFTAGGNQGAFFNRDSRNYVQLFNHLTRAYRNHTLKVGLEAKADRLENIDQSGWGGTFIFGSDVERDAAGVVVVDAAGQTSWIPPIENYRRTLLGRPGYGPSQFSQTRGEPAIALSQWETAWFAQDDWRPSPRLTLSYGVRSEGQTNIQSGLHLGPRLGMAWSADDKGLGRLRAGAGMFYTRVDPSLSLDARRLDGQHQQEVIVQGPRFFPEPPADIQGTASSFSSIRGTAADLAPPYAVVSSLSYERQMPRNLFGSVEYRTQHGERLLRTRRLAGVAGPPVLQFESTGSSSQHEIVAGMRAYLRGQLVFVNYTLSFSRSDTDGAYTLPADSSDLSPEFGWATSDQRHRLVLSGTVALPMGISVSPYITFGSGRPFNITTGRDNNGDTVFTDRPALTTSANPEAILTPFGWLNANPRPGDRIVARNVGRGTGEIGTNLYAFRPFKLKAPWSNQPDGAGQPMEYSLILGASVENLINHVNLTGFNSVLTSSSFGQPTRSLGPRRIQVSLSMSF